MSNSAVKDSIFLIVSLILSFSLSPNVALRRLAKADRSSVNGTIPGVISEKSNSLKPSTVSPDKIKTSKIGGKDWRTMHEDSLEFYLDYETMNSNLGHIIVENNNINIVTVAFGSHLSKGYLENISSNSGGDLYWIYKHFCAPRVPSR